MAVALAAVLTMSIVLTGCGKKADEAKKGDTTTATDGSKNKEKLVLTVGDNKIHMDEMMYYIFMQEYQLAQTEQMYLAYMGQSYLDSEYSEGVTVRDMAKQSTMDAATTYEILYQEALKAKFELTEEELKECDTMTESFMSAITEEQLKLTGLNKELVRKIAEKLSLSMKYMDDTIQKFDIDDEGIKAGIKKEDYRQYNTEYLYVSTSKTDEAGNQIDPTAAEKKESKAKLAAVLDKAKAGEEFAKIVEADTSISTQPSNFVAGKNSVDPEYEKAALTLENNKLSKIVETSDGYYIIKMLDNNSEEAYNTACTEAITAEEQKQFTAKYEELLKNYKVEVNQKEWDPIVMGKTTIVETAPTTEAPAETPAIDDGSAEAPATDEAPAE